MIGMFLALGAGLGVVAGAPSVPVSGAGVVLLGVGFGTLGSLYRSIMTGIAPEALRGGLVSLSESIGRVIITVAPVVMGVLVAWLTPEVGLPMAVRLRSWRSRRRCRRGRRIGAPRGRRPSRDPVIPPRHRQPR